MAKERESLDFQTFLEFLFVLIAKSLDDHPDRENYAEKIRTVLITLCVTLIAGGAELNCRNPKTTDPLFDEESPSADNQITDFLKDVYNGYNILRTLHETGPVDPE